MKRRMPSGQGFVVSLAHGYFGYMPTPEQCKLGGYETWIGTNRLEPEAAPKMSGRFFKAPPCRDSGADRPPRV